MRKQDELIQVLFNIYVGHKWDCMEEYWEVAYALLVFHGARFMDLGDVKTPITDEIRGSLCEMGYSIIGERNRRKYMDKLYDLIDNDEELNRLNKYDDSEEGWREEINAGPESLEYFGTVCNKFITFKY